MKHRQGLLDMKGVHLNPLHMKRVHLNPLHLDGHGRRHILVCCRAPITAWPVKATSDPVGCVRECCALLYVSVRSTPVFVHLPFASGPCVGTELILQPGWAGVTMLPCSGRRSGTEWPRAIGR